MSRKSFSKANRLWFREGRTAKALAAYDAALRADPGDPVVAFQFARALWSVDRFDEARALLTQAYPRRGELTDVGRWHLDHWRDRLQQRPPERRFPELPPADLDRDRLERGRLSAGDWRTVADAAAAREMFGVAVYALDRWGGVPIDAEAARDILDIESRRHAEEAMLDEIRASSQPPPRDLEARVPEAPPRPAKVRPKPAAPQRKAPRASPPAAAPAERRQDLQLPELALTLTVRATPVKGPVGVSTEIVATLRNPTATALVVNRRMLLNRVGAAGEIWLDVKGPDGYRNTVSFFVRAGRAGEEFFVSLAPGEAVEKSWRLNKYQTLRMPGEYLVTLTYHNEAVRSPDGRPMKVGQVAGSTRIYRYA